MLTATYSLIAISIEQKNVYHMLSSLKESIQGVSWEYKERFDIESVNAMLRKLLDFNKFCRGRKVETLMIPAVRRSSVEQSTLLSELENLSQEALKNIRSLYRQTQVVDETEEPSAETLLSLMEEYCHNLARRFEKEEIELFPVAKQLLSNDDWFSIAVACMQDETKTQKQRYGKITSAVSHKADEQLSFH